MTSNVGQNYPYSSESESDRAARVATLLEEKDGLKDKVSAETTPLDERERWWTWKCPTSGCKGILHAAGYARDLHAVYVVCDGSTRMQPAPLAWTQYHQLVELSVEAFHASEMLVSELAVMWRFVGVVGASLSPGVGGRLAAAEAVRTSASTRGASG